MQRAYCRLVGCPLVTKESQRYAANMMSHRAEKFLNDFTTCESVAAQDWHQVLQNVASFEDATESEYQQVIDSLLGCEIPSHARAQAMVELLLQALVKRALTGDVAIVDDARISLFYRHLGPFSRSRAFLLRLLTLVHTQD